ncbi:hypothetical protein PoB_003406200 [Plakobranchus ocellatus]|uniref:Uncharacterized protein n=1 Tax=Plakobranchus ocellatus TaxID=259542 RepID=A0AAV4AKY1_9GAST|nr:hypothetical protein PoB_003406200 [Plakobranchus ocellatus]
MTYNQSLKYSNMVVGSLGYRIIESSDKEKRRTVDIALKDYFSRDYVWFGFCIQPIHNKVISGFQVLRQARSSVAGLEPATKGSLHISGRIHFPLCHRRPMKDDYKPSFFS